RALLTLNGRSLGEKMVADRYDPVLRWDVPNEPGTVRVVGYRNVAEAARFVLTTANAPHHLELSTEPSTLATAGLLYVEVRVADAAGTRTATGAQDIQVQVSGAGELLAIDSA